MRDRHVVVGYNKDSAIGFVLLLVEFGREEQDIPYWNGVIVGIFSNLPGGEHAPDFELLKAFDVSQGDGLEPHKTSVCIEARIREWRLKKLFSVRLTWQVQPATYQVPTNVM